MAKKNNKSCVYLPLIKGEPSELYQGLTTKLQDRPLVNYLYSSYLVPGTADAMDTAGFVRNKQGEHNVEDVYNFFEVNDILNDRSISLNTVSRSLGIMDAYDQPIDMDMDDAYAKAQSINNSHKGRNAFVVQNGDKFNVILENKDSRTQIRVAEVNEQMAVWQAFKSGMNSIGIDAQAMANEMPNLVNPLRVTDFLGYLNSLYKVNNSDLTERDIKVLVMVGQSLPIIRNLITRWGGIDAAAHNAYEIMQDPTGYSQSIVNIVGNDLNDVRTWSRQGLLDLSNRIRLNILPDLRKNSPERNIQSELARLHSKYGIDSEIIVRTSKEIRTLSEATADAIISLERQLKVLKSKEDTGKFSAEIEATLNTLLGELQHKKYYSGLLTFLNQATEYSNKINKLLTNIPQQGTALEYARARSDAYMKAKNFIDSYLPIVSALAKLDTLVIDESISKEDRANLKSISKTLEEDMGKYGDMLRDLRDEVMLDMCKEVFGDKPIDGIPLATFITMAREDSSIMDYLYSMSRASNPLIAAMGTIIRDAQTERDGELAQYSERIRKAQAELNGSTEFMYEMIDGKYYIISPYDWSKYNELKRQAYREYKRNGADGVELKELMELWEVEHTEEVLVDAVNNRYERVPKYYKPINPLLGLSDAQYRYYQTMMQIKGELGTMLPLYAQNQYLPVQRRASWSDVVKLGIDGKISFKEMMGNLLDRMNPIKIRQDDTRFTRNSIQIDGLDYINASGAFDNTLIKRIPIYYMNRLENQNDLLLDFSASIASFAATALNYDAMDGIKNTIELMSDFVNSQPIAHKSGEKTLAELVKTQGVAIAKVLHLRSESSRTAALLEGFTEQHLYGITMKDTNTAARILQALINYTSMRQLTVNVKGAISNALVGEAQMIIEAVAGSFNKMFKRDSMYGIDDYAKAHLILVGNKFTPGVYSDHITGNKTSKALLLEELFDPMQEVYGDLGSRRFSSFARIHGGFDTMGMYKVGESLIHIVNMYAMLNHSKVLLNGKRISVYDALEVSEPESKNAHLKFKDRVTDLNGNPIDINSDFVFDLKEKIRYINQQTHGSMNTEDKGLIQRRIAGRAVMNFRQWMVEHYSRRYRGRHWDGTLNAFTEGYWTTMLKFFRNYIRDYSGFVTTAKAQWNNLDEGQKNNIMRCLSEVAVLAALNGLAWALGDPSDHKKEWWYRMWIYQVKRLILDETASVPWGIPSEAKTIIQSPVASVNTVNAIMYPFIGLTNGDLTHTIESGRHEGWNKYGRNLLKYTVPFYGQIDQLAHMDEEDYIFNMFNTQRNY